MAYEEVIKNISVDSNADLSGSQYRFCDVNSAGKLVVVSAAGAKAIGVLQNKPAAADRASTVAIGGTSRVLSSGTIAAGADVASTNDGRAASATTGQVVLGTAMESAVAGDIFPVLLQKAGATKA